MKTILIVVLLLSLLLNGWLLWDRREAQNERFADNSRLNDIISSKQAEISNADTIISIIRERMRKDSLKNMPLITGLKLQARTLRQKLAELGEITTQEVADTTCTRLIQVSQLKDSVIAKQDDLISTLELSHAAEIRDFNEILSIHQQKFIAQQQISEAWMETAAEARKDAVKERKKKNFFKITSGILTAGILFLAVRE